MPLAVAVGPVQVDRGPGSVRCAYSTTAGEARSSGVYPGASPEESTELCWSTTARAAPAPRSFARSRRARNQSGPRPSAGRGSRAARCARRTPAHSREAAGRKPPGSRPPSCGRVVNSPASIFAWSSRRAAFQSLMCLIAWGCTRAIRTGQEVLDEKLMAKGVATARSPCARREAAMALGGPNIPTAHTLPLITLEKAKLDRHDSRICRPLRCGRGLARAVKDTDERRGENVQAASKVENADQAWITSPMFDIDHAAEAHPAAFREFFCAHSSRFAHPPHVHPEGMKLGIGGGWRHNVDLIRGPYLTAMNSCA